jgi:hypothetical protein
MEYCNNMSHFKFTIALVSKSICLRQRVLGAVAACIVDIFGWEGAGGRPFRFQSARDFIKISTTSLVPLFPFILFFFSHFVLLQAPRKLSTTSGSKCERDYVL